MEIEGKKVEKVLEQIQTESSNVHALLVDDNGMNLRVAEEMLATYGIKVTKAYSGQEALDKIISMDYDFVFMDHMMPKMDGVETLHHIRKMVGTYYQNVPIIAVTANAVAGNREKLLKEGFDDFLEKPIERSVLERVLRRTLPDDKFVVDRSLGKVQMKKIAEQTPDWMQILEEIGLDVKKAVLYCNGKEAYYKILQGYCEEGEKNEELLEKLYQDQDWKNYTIAVHGTKSAMRSIGAVEVSEIARGLENAGKNLDTEYIMEYHNKLMVAYKYLFTKLKVNIFSGGLSGKEKNMEEVQTTTAKKEELKELSLEELEQMISDMENAVYTFDEQYLLRMAEELKKCCFCGKSMEEIMKKVERKIEMSDLISAVEMLMRWKEITLDEENRKCGKK